MERSRPRFSTEYLISDYKNDAGNFSPFEFVIDVGDGGVFIETSRPLKVGTRIEIRLTLLGMRNQIYASGIVRWTRKDLTHKGQIRGMGVEFEFIQSGLVDQVQRIEAFEHLSNKNDTEEIT